jgi:uncharacterized protein (TIGR02679 family)
MRWKMMRECQQYFKSRSVYQKLFAKMREKYASLGHFGGRLVLSDLTEEEKIQLGGFVKKDYTRKSSVSVSMTLLQKSLEESCFCKFTWEEILEEYFEQALIVKKEQKQTQEQKKQEYFSRILEQDAGKIGRKWFEKVLEEKALGYQLVQKQYGQDELLSFVLQAIDNLPVFRQKSSRLAVFAAEITGNPHYFDDGTTANKLLLYFLQYYFNSEGSGESRPEKKNFLFYQAGIVNDDLSNYVLTYGFYAKRKNGIEHEGINGYTRVQEPVQITLFTLQGLESIEGNKKIYVVENPSVFSILIEENPKISAICTNGQLRLSTLVLMDMLSKESYFYYAGDFDPEGLLIAQTLKERYKEHLYLWNYESKYYQEAKSEVGLSAERLKKLEKVYCEELQEIKKELEKEKKAGYQENMSWKVL